MKVWCTPYESVGAKDSKEGDETTGGGLAWGGGCSPSLTRNLVMFTDNQDPVNLLALDMKTGEKVASMPVIDELPEDMQVSVENSAIVYDNGEGTVSTIVCNWFGAGSAKLADADNDSSIQSYENIYDVNWLRQGNKMIMPGVERVDTIKTEDGYEMKSIWCRSDMPDTSMMKLSTQQDIFTVMFRIWKLACGSLLCLILRPVKLYFQWMCQTNLDTTIWQSVCMQETVEMHYTVQPDIWNF